MSILDRDPINLHTGDVEPDEEAPSIKITPADPELYARGMEDPRKFLLAGLALSVEQGYLDESSAHQLRELKAPENKSTDS